MWPWKSRKGREGFESCGTCEFWAGGVVGRTSDAGAVAACRRYAPSPVYPAEHDYSVNENHRFAVWPLTESMDYCGEYKPRRGTGIGTS